MNILIEPHQLSGSIAAMPSKSVAHRLLILSGLCSGITDIACTSFSDDIAATLRCLKALGAPAMRTRLGVRMVPVTVGGVRAGRTLDVGESGSTLRFLLPVVAALGCKATFALHGRLPERPLAPLDQQLCEHGVELSGLGTPELSVSGQLSGGRFMLPGSVSSQYVSGLLMAAPLLDEDVEILVREPVESKGYIKLTLDALANFGVEVACDTTTVDDVRCRRYALSADQHLSSPRTCEVEGDWSNAGFWLGAGALGSEPLCITGLNLSSGQGDRAIMAALSLLGARIGRSSGIVAASRDNLRGRTINVSDIPDLAAPLAAVGAYAQGTTRLCGARRLRLKESDRLATICNAICALGGKAEVVSDDLVIEGVPQLCGGTVDACNDHRIAMMAAICAAYASGPCVIVGAECVAKSYPTFFEDFRALGGIAREQKD